MKKSLIKLSIIFMMSAILTGCARWERKPSTPTGYDKEKMLK